MRFQTNAAYASIAHAVITIAICALGIAILALLYGFGPGLLHSAGMNQFFLGLAHCYSANLPAIYCDAVAHPEGYTIVFGMPYVLPVAVLNAMGLPLLFAGRVIEFIYLSLAFSGCYALVRSFDVRSSIALVTSFVFLASPIVFAQDGYGPLRLGFALLPLYGLIDLLVARRIADARTRSELVLSFAKIIILLALVRCFALFLDGYSFVMGLALSAGLLMPLLFKLFVDKSYARIALIGLCFFVSTVIAYIAYRLYAGDTVEASVMPIDLFRGQGVDLYALAVPSWMQWFGSLLGIHHSLNGWMSFSDGPGVTYVYLGWLLIVVLVIGLFMFFSRFVTEKQRINFVALLLVFAGSFLISLGPSLKIADFRDTPPPDRFITFADYLMPESEATLSLGTALLYQHVPGVRNMRAVYRWVLLVKLSLLLIAALVLERLMSQSRWKVVSGLILFAVVLELLPNIPQRLEYGKRQLNQYEAFAQDALVSLKELNLDGQTVLLLPLNPAGEWNHFTANFLCPLANLKCFNLGGDKSLMQARTAWPIELRELSRGRWVSGNLRTLLLDENIGAVLIPLFSLRGASYQWPPSPSVVEQILSETTVLAAESGIVVERRGWFLQLSIDSSTIDFWRPGTSAKTDFEILRWGPVNGSFDEGFNVQSDGRSAFWVLFSEQSGPNERMVLALGGHVLETHNNSTALSGKLIYPSDRDKFPPGKYPLEVVDRLTGETQLIGEFTVVEQQ